jgi:hypothetical protein
MKKTLPCLAVLALSAASAPSAFGDFSSTFQELSPTTKNFVLGVEEEPFFFDPGDPTNSAPATGSASGPLFAVPNLGCNASDFSGFVAGDIALIQRGGLGCLFSIKGLDAQAAGAAGYVVYDNSVETLPSPILGVPGPAIPGVFITNADGLALRAAAGSGAVDVSLSVTSAPEPGVFSLLAVGLACLAWKLRNRIA